MRSLKQETDNRPRSSSGSEPAAGPRAVAHHDTSGETRVFVPWALRYRAAQRRVVRGLSSRPDRILATQCFAQSIEQLQLLGLQGSGLTIAAEYMAKDMLRSRLRSARRPELRCAASRSAQLVLA